ncbi:BamA/OMP85 family outer membrane protein [Halanaerobium hydrogeniformans]|uniref:Surface antigen (D15) n=1 Tax=Halanaerobium hydrogeniformans TaxID=656519 RepID=E4RP64_HALHG|nr:BamA/TamA family outer membrane protein [Halanaerobium hydrogeniformans]ADQ13889.1 surface antigen (D15) [Halanaerobium hydrogeniformans]
MKVKFLSIKTILILSLILFAFVTVSASAQQIPIDEITRISVEGNEHISESEILDQVETEVGEQTDQDALRADMQAVYDLGYFADVNIVFENYEDGLHVIFEVVENPIINEINISGYEEIYSEERVLEILDIEIDKVLNARKMNENLRSLQEKIQDDGYILARYTDVSVSEEGVLNIEINPGYLVGIEIEGNDKTQDKVILREMPISEGDVVNIRNIQQGYQNLVRLQYFENISPELERVDPDENTAKLVISLDEAQTGRLNFGGGYSSKDGWLGFVDVSEENLFGRGQRIAAKWQFGDTTTYSLNFNEPYLWDTNYSFGFSLYDTTTERTNIDDERYEESKRGGSVTLGRPLPRNWRTSLRYRLEDSDIEWLDDVDDDDTSTSLRSLTLGFNRNTADSTFHPRSGSHNNFNIEHAGDFIGGDVDFTKFNIDSRKYLPGFSDHAIALRAKAGITYPRTDLPRSEQYNLGGSDTLRGYERSDFDFRDKDNNNLLLFNVEYRIPFNESFSGVLFTDAGNVWDERGKISISDLNYGYGLGARMNTPVGQLRLDYGWNEDGDGQLHFSIGSTF